MRRVLLAAAAGLVLAALSPAQAQAADRCAARESKTLRLTPAVRVYRRAESVYGCLRSSGVRRRLAGGRPLPNEIHAVELVRVAGVRVAWVHTSFCTVCGEAGASSSIGEVDLRSGRRRALHDVRDRPEGSSLGTVVDALALDRCGRIAYRASLHDAYRRGTYKDPRLFIWIDAERRELDAGAIDRRSIRLAPGAVHWARDGEARSAPLEPAC